MTIHEALIQRKSTRSFLQTPVEKDLIVQILEEAKWAPSGGNIQPWHVCVVSGAVKKSIESKIRQAFEEQEQNPMEYFYYPLKWEEPYKSRRKETGLQLYQTLGITKEDVSRQKEQWIQNYFAFGAPIVLYFFIDKSLEKGSFLDYGMFLQSLMLSATSKGLATCAQASLGEYPNIIKSILNIDDTKTLVCGMALGYENKNALINSFKTSRIAVEDFTSFYE